MEEAWYLFPGQTLETTKIKDRGKALVASKAAWDKITDHLRQKQYQQEIIDEEETRKAYLKEGSKVMTKNWTNSFEKIQERRMRDLTMKAKLKEELLVNRFLELRAEQQAERDIILSQLSRKLYMTTEKPRQLNTALIQSEVYFERQLQCDFNKQIREQEKVEELNEAIIIKQRAQEEVAENEAKAKWRRDKDMKHCEELKQQIQEIQEMEKQTREETVNNEIEDIKRSKEEYEEILQWEKDEAKRKKDDVKKQFNDFLNLQKEIREERERQDRIQDKIIKIFERGNCRINEMKEEAKKNARDQETAIRAAIAEKLLTVKLANEGEENERIAIQVREREEREDKVKRKKEAYQQRLKQEKEDYLKFVKEQKAKQEDEDNEIKKWEFLNRLKTMEVMEKYNLDKLQELFDAKIKYRRILDEQKNTRLNNKNKYRKLCYEAEMKEIRDQIELEDNQFFEYAQEVYDLAKSRGRDTYPIQKVIDKYKKETGLMYKPPTHDPRFVISTIPIGVAPRPDKNKKAIQKQQEQAPGDDCECCPPQPQDKK